MNYWNTLTNTTRKWVTHRFQVILFNYFLLIKIGMLNVLKAWSFLSIYSILSNLKRYINLNFTFCIISDESLTFFNTLYEYVLFVQLRESHSSNVSVVWLMIISSWDNECNTWLLCDHIWMTKRWKRLRTTTVTSFW